MREFLSRSLLRFYPRADFRTRVEKQFDLKTVCRTFRDKYPFLNLSGLAKVRRLSVHVCSVESEQRIWHNFKLFFDECGIGDQRYATIEYSTDSREIDFSRFFPDLPNGKKLGITLFFLILARGNTFAGRIIVLDTPLDDMIKMVKHLNGFKVDNEPDNGRITIKMPKLTPEEVAAVEWYWVNVLKCPLL